VSKGDSERRRRFGRVCLEMREEPLGLMESVGCPYRTNSSAVGNREVVGEVG
jgi:hypothetical protein